MTTLREAAQQALEVEADRRRKALAAEMRAALAQQAEPTWVCPESPEHRYAKPGHCEDCGKTLVLAQEQGCDHCNHPLYAATRCRVCGRVTEQAEPVEPVAKCIDDICSEHFGRVEAFDYLPRETLLYTSPPQRKPLTEEEIDELSRTMVKGDKSVNWLCRAVERAHGIGGQE